MAIYFNQTAEGDSVQRRLNRNQQFRLALSLAVNRDEIGKLKAQTTELKSTNERLSSEKQRLIEEKKQYAADNSKLKSSAPRAMASSAVAFI